MKKRLLAAMGLTGVLASCGSMGGNTDANGRIVELKTEYKLQDGRYVACDETTLLDGSTRRVTQVSVVFALSGTVTSIQASLKGATPSPLDSNYATTVAASQLTPASDGNYKVLFNADSSAALLPASIIVAPAAATVKTVSATELQGSFYTDMTVNTPSAGSFDMTSRNLGSDGNIPVYSKCTVISNTAVPL